MGFKLSTFVLAPAILAASALSTFPAMAATAGATTLKVPFSFMVEGQNLPAGEYTVQRENSGGFVKLQNAKTFQSFTWIAESSPTHSDRVVLKFEGQGETHVLESIQYGPLMTTKLDRKTRKAEDVSPQVAPGQ